MSTAIKAPCDEGVLQSGTAQSPCPPSTGPWVLAATILGSSMVFIDGTVVNVALPALQTALKASASDLQWVVESYALFLAALILVGGSLGDHYGRRLVFAIGVAMFTLASVWCGLAPNITQLIIARAAQGIGGALLTPGSLSLISASFGEDERGKAIGTWSGATSITSAIGPLLGGWLVQHISWRAIFFLNAPLAVAVLAVTLWKVPESRDEQASAHLDYGGAALATLGLGALVYGLIELPELKIANPRVWGALTVGVLALAGFVAVEARRADAMMPLTLFRSKTFSGANLLTLLLYSALGGALYFIPFDLIQVRHYSPTAAEAALLPLILVISVLSRWTGGLTAKFGARLPLIIGPCIAGIGFGLFALPGLGGSYWTTFFPAAIVLGFGLAVSVPPLTTAVMGSVEDRYVGVASGVNNAVSRTASLIAVAVFGAVVFSVFSSGLHRRLASLPSAPKNAILAQTAKLAGIALPLDMTTSDRVSASHAVAQSYLDGFRATMLLAAVLAFVSAASAAVTIEGSVTMKPDAEPMKNHA